MTTLRPARLRLVLIASTVMMMVAAMVGARSSAHAAPFGLQGGPEIGEVPPLPIDQVPPPLVGIEIQDKRGVRLPQDLMFTDHNGKAVRLGDYLDGKPLVLVLAYYGCPSLCSLVINELSKGMQGLDWTAGKQYRALVVSFDPRDGAAVAAEKRAAYLEQYGRTLGDDRGWDFLIGTPGEGEANVKQLAALVGFPYRWDPDVKQYAHAAGVFVFTPDGRLSRTLYGLTGNTKDLRLSLVEASDGKLGSLGDKITLFCYRWDRHAKGFVLATARIMKAAAALTVLVLVIWLLTYWRRERRRQAAHHGART